MGGRYLITGFQLGMLKTLEEKEKQELLDKITEHQFVFDSEDEISVDVEYTSEAVVPGGR